MIRRADLRAERDRAAAALGGTLLPEYASDPVGFSRDIVGVDPWSRQAEILQAVSDSPRVLVKSGHKVGKAVDDDTPVLTTGGWKRHGDLEVGDSVFDEHGRPVEVLSVSRWRRRPVMRVHFECGSSIVADERHEWLVRSGELGAPRVLETREIYAEQWSDEHAIDVPDGAARLRAAKGRRPPLRAGRLRVVRVERLEKRRRTSCIEVDSPTHLYLVGEALIPTHNSLSAAILAFWFVATRHEARVIMTAPTFPQVKGILWREIRRWWPRVRATLGGPKYPPVNPMTGIEMPGHRQIFGISTNEPERLAGISGGNMLFIIDEGSGFPDELYETLVGNAAGNALIVSFSNPTKSSGWFFEGFQNGLWRTVTVSSEETPNVQAGKVVVPGLAAREWLELIRKECGTNYRQHPMYQVRVLGIFPSAGPASVFGLEETEGARARWTPSDHTWFGRLQIGVDPSRYGDDPTVIQPVRGSYAFMPTAIEGRVDGPRIAREVVQIVRRHRRPTDGAVPVFVDSVAVGAGAVDSLRLHEASRLGEIYVVELETGGPAVNTKYANLRSEMWFGGAQWVRDGGALPLVPHLTQELLAAEYAFNSKGQQYVLAKKRMRQVLGRSPNYADALCYAVRPAPLHGPGHYYAGEADEEDDDDEGRDFRF